MDSPPPATPVTVETIDGTVAKGRWGGVDGVNRVVLTDGSDPTAFAMDDLVRVTFAAPSSDALSETTVFHLADGGALAGELLASEADALVVRTSLADPARIPLDRLAAVRLAAPSQYRAAMDRFSEALADRLPGQDVLITRSADDVRTVRGRLDALDPAAGTFVMGDKVRSFSTDKIFGVVFAAGAGRAERFPVTLHLRDGGRVSGRLESGAQDHIRFATSLGFQADVRLDRVAEMAIDSPRLVFVSDLPMEHHVSEGRLHPGWSVGIDHNVAGGRLAMDGVRCGRGLGMHSRGEVRYRLDGVYETFVATVGLDDAVRPRGSVVFRVLADGTELFDSGLVRGIDAPRDIRVDITAVNTLTLVVDYGDGLDLSDYADWCGARLIRPRDRGARDD